MTAFEAVSLDANAAIPAIFPCIAVVPGRFKMCSSAFSKR